MSQRDLLGKMMVILPTFCQSKNCYDVSILILYLMMTLITGLSLWEFSSKAVDFSHTIAQSLKTLKQKIGFIWVIGANYKIDLQHSIFYVSCMYSFNRFVSIFSKITPLKSGSRKSKNSKMAQNTLFKTHKSQKKNVLGYCDTFLRSTIWYL